MTTAIGIKGETQVARPLSILVPLIKEDLQQGREASERAAHPYYRAAGEKMIEARDGQGMTLRELHEWTQRNFGIGRGQVELYMKYARATAGLSSQDAPSLHQYRISRGMRQNVYPAAWQQDVKPAIERAKRDAERIRDEQLTRQQEREAEQSLALRLIDIGYKVLAKELHPDKGGSKDAMARLGRVRDRLKQHA